MLRPIPPLEIRAMFAVVSCRKYSQNVMRVANVAQLDTVEKVQAVLNDSPAMECRICGPMSHVELQWADYHTAHSVHESEEEATQSAMTMASAQPHRYDISFLPSLEKQC